MKTRNILLTCNLLIVGGLLVDAFQCWLAEQYTIM